MHPGAIPGVRSVGGGALEIMRGCTSLLAAKFAERPLITVTPPTFIDCNLKHWATLGQNPSEPVLTLLTVLYGLFLLLLSPPLRGEGMEA